MLWLQWISIKRYNMTKNDIKEWFHKITADKKRLVLWIILLILFPYAAGLFLLWPSNLLKDRMPRGWKIFCWVIYAPIGLSFVVLKLFAFVWVIAMCADPNAWQPYITHENISAPEYRTAEDFYKLTGVEFPELEMVDSLFYDEGIITSCTWHEYKFVAKEGLDEDFFKRLDHACQTDSTHWGLRTGSIGDYFYRGTGEPIKEDESMYSYFIYPDQTPVDRSRGMCDRMVTMDDGSVVNDWDGSFISVEIQKDTIVLRDGWLR